MGYGYFDEAGDNSYGGGGGGGGYDPNRVTTNTEALPYSDAGQYGSSGYGGAGTAGGFSMAPATGGSYSQGSGGAFSGEGGSQSSGLGSNPYTAIFGMIGDRLQGRINAIQAASAAHAAIPSEAYAQALRGFVDQAATQGKQLADSKLGPNATAAASVVGSRSANARGLTGPLAASVQSNSVNQAQSNYNQWRTNALMNARQSYFGLVQQYLAALEARRQAQIQAGYADRESFFAKLPIGPIGKAIGEGVADLGNGQYSSKTIQGLGAYDAGIANF